MKARVKSSDSLSLERSVKAEPATALFALLEEHEHEQVSLVYEPSSGYRGIIAIHDTTLGPALGGTRFWNYSNDREALIDCLRLARGMTYNGKCLWSRSYLDTSSRRAGTHADSPPRRPRKTRIRGKAGWRGGRSVTK